MSTSYRTIPVGEVEVFYREAGSAEAPVVLLLHGFPTSSHMFRELIPILSREYRVIAPDLPGFGSTVAPARGGSFSYTFDSLAETMDGFVEALGIERFSMYVFDYGAPVGFRLALKRPKAIEALVTQNGNAYEEGLTGAWGPIRAYWETGAEAEREALRGLLALETTHWQYVEGVPDALRERVSPDAAAHDQAILDREGSDQIQLDLFHDYRTNPAAYPAWQAWLREHRPPVLAIWGRNDPFFAAAGAEAYLRDVPDAEVVLLDTGHFALETHAAEVGERMLAFLGQQHARA